MHTMTEQERAEALTAVLEHFGELMAHPRTDNRLQGAVTLTFNEHGQFSLGFVGVLDKALTMGALTDCLLTFREIANTKESNDIALGLIQSLTIPDNRKN